MRTRIARIASLLLTACLIGTASPGIAEADKRVALVIGSIQEMTVAARTPGSKAASITSCGVR
jgi:hypothetical protein